MSDSVLRSGQQPMLSLTGSEENIPSSNRFILMTLWGKVSVCLSVYMYVVQREGARQRLHNLCFSQSGMNDAPSGSVSPQWTNTELMTKPWNQMCLCVCVLLIVHKIGYKQVNLCRCTGIVNGLALILYFSSQYLPHLFHSCPYGRGCHARPIYLSTEMFLFYFYFLFQWSAIQT